jgi:hypothetical protein
LKRALVHSFGGCVSLSGGCWVRAYNFWLRSPNVSNTNFWNVNNNGNLNNNNASNTNGLCLGFSENQVALAKFKQAIVKQLIIISEVTFLKNNILEKEMVTPQCSLH